MKRRSFIRKRAAERGAAVFVVVLVLAMLGAVGFFAAQSSLSGAATSGAMRAASLGEKAAGTAMAATMASLAKSPEAHLSFMTNHPAAGCLGEPAALFPSPCARLGRSSLEHELGVSFFTPYDPNLGAHGSLGRASAETDFLVEVTDVHGLDKPIPGFEASRAGPVDVRFSSVVVHAEGRVRLAPQNAPKSTLSSTTIRAELVLGPLAVH